MKKILCSVLTLSCLLFSTSCTNSAKIYPIYSGLSFTACCSYGENEFLLDTMIFKNSNTDFQMYFKDNTPSVVISYTKHKIKFSYDSIEYETDISALASSTITDFIYSVFYDLKKNPVSVSYNNDLCVIEKNLENYKYKLYVGTTGLPIKLIETSKDIEIIFKNQSII